MDIGSTARVPALPPLGETARPPAVRQDGVKTELPKEASVQQSATPDADAAVRPGARPPLPGDLIGRNITVDIETRKVVFQAIDKRTGDVVSQFPDPRYLQAYRDQLRAAAEAEDGKTALTERLA